MLTQMFLSQEFLLIFSCLIISRYVGSLPVRWKIYDLGHQYIKKYTKNPGTTYLVLQCMSLSPPVITYLCFGLPLNYLTIMHLCRIPAYYLTQLPLLDNSRHRKYNKYLFGLAGGSNDFIWSGHVSTLAYTSIHVWKYFDQNINLLCGLIAYNFYLCLLIIATRNHYTVDVYIGLLIGALFRLIQ